MSNQSKDHIRDAYNRASQAYARQFVDELVDKPMDRDLLQQFANNIGTSGTVLDLGCGPGHTTAHLTSLGLQAIGVDLSPGMIRQASWLFPKCRFRVGDFSGLDDDDGSVAGILAFYCIVHLTPDQLPMAFAEMFRVLQLGGSILMSFHAGTGVVHTDSFLDSGAQLDFILIEPEQVRAALAHVGFREITVTVRPPYETEHPSTRCYVTARKPERGH